MKGVISFEYEGVVIIVYERELVSFVYEGVVSFVYERSSQCVAIKL